MSRARERHRARDRAGPFEVMRRRRRLARAEQATTRSKGGGALDLRGARRLSSLALLRACERAIPSSENADF